MNNSITTQSQKFSFLAPGSFEEAQRICKAYASSSLVPVAYQNNVSNCLIAMELAMRLEASALMIMQNLYIVHGKPAWSAQFVISSINTCGRFKPLRYEITGNDGTDEYGCIAWTTEKGTQLPEVAAYILEQLQKHQRKISAFQAYKELGVDLLVSPRVSIKMSKDEGWYSKNGSKWKTMPELMLTYRSASFFGRLYAPEIMMGMQTAEEVNDYSGPENARNVTPSPSEENIVLAERFSSVVTQPIVREFIEPIAIIEPTPPDEPNMFSNVDVSAHHNIIVDLESKQETVADYAQAAKILLDNLERYKGADYRRTILKKNSTLINEIYSSGLKEEAMKIAGYAPEDEGGHNV